jgi:hypothetical protein
LYIESEYSGLGCTGKKFHLKEDIAGYHLITSLQVQICFYLLNLHILLHLALGDFFSAFEKDNPWWLSIIHPVNGDDETSLFYLLGFEHSVGLQFLCSTGLLKERHS